MHISIKYLAPASLLIVLSSCATPEYQAAESGCRAVFNSKIPPRFEQEMYNQSQTRQVPTGQTTCTGYGNMVSCQQVMRTEYYTIPAVRTVDRNAPMRNAQIQACTRSKCIQQYGNAECKATSK